VVVQAAVFTIVLIATLTLYPAGDMIAWIGSYFDARRDGDWLRYLWLPHIEHRVPVVRILVAADVLLFHGSGLALVCAATLAVLTTAVMAYRVLRPGFSPDDAAPPLAGVGVMIVLTTEAAVDASTPVNVIYPLAVACAVAALLLFRPARGRPWRGVAAIGMAIMAGFCCAWGLAVWPALAWLAWRGRAARAWVVGIVAVAVADAGLYTYPRSAALICGAWRAVMPPLQFGRFLVAFAGLPLSRDAALAPVGAVVGVAMLAAGAAALTRTARGDRQRVVGQAFIVAGLAGAILVAAGRAGLADGDHLPVRYSFLLVPLHLGLLLVAMPLVPGRRMRTVAVGLAVWLLVLQVAASVPALRIASARRDALARFYAGERDPAMNPALLFDADTAAGILRKAGWGEAAPPRPRGATR
jgi:hypothetical protein